MSEQLRLDTVIVRTPYEGDAHVHSLRRHFEGVVEQIQLLPGLMLGVSSGYTISAGISEWWSVIHFDRKADS